MSEETPNLPQLEPSVKWRGSTYNLVRVSEDGGKVFWHNPISRHNSSCSVAAWKRSDPYDRDGT